MATDLEEMRDRILRMMKSSLAALERGHVHTANEQMRYLKEWVGVMRELLPAHAEQTLEAVMIELQRQNRDG